MIKRLLTYAATLFSSTSMAANETAEEKLWQQTYGAREHFYEENFGKLPHDILKLTHLFGVWPRGGLFVITPQKLGEDLWVYSTFGFTNPDMPATMTSTNVTTKTTGKRVDSTSLTLELKEKVRERTARPGYGYEVLVLAREQAEWPLGILQWVTNAEILNDADLLSRVEKYNGITVEEVNVGDGRRVNLLIAKAQAPLPATMTLPNGNAQFLVATVITEEEMDWSKEHGREGLLSKLQDGGIKQVSVLERPSVIK
ncbi:MAG: hypothetical protein JWO94_120 [Verrucomicrobiaceae bacterium]|nr:hypothetical protein [Verrucomicrobiaceae bacterium]